MGFALKKLIASLLMPLPIGMFALLAGLFYLLRSRTQKAQRWLWFAFVWLFLLSYDPFTNMILYPLEHRIPALLKIPKKIDYIYVLGYGHHTDPSLSITSQLDTEAITRLNEGIRLYRKIDPHPKLILSGYRGKFDPTPHAFMQRTLAIALGVDEKDIICVPEAKDTQEEAEAARRIVGDRALILVTSAYHMPRSLGWFREAGLTPLAAPTYHQSRASHLNWTGFFSATALKRSTVAFHEYLGIAWQYLKTFL